MKSHTYRLNFGALWYNIITLSVFLAGKNTTIRKVFGPGKHFGLHLRLSVEQDEYVGFLGFSAGLRVRIHDPDEPPLVSSLGFAVMPSSHVFASITRQKVRIFMLKILNRFM